MRFPKNSEEARKRVLPLFCLQNRQNNLWGFIVTEYIQYFHTVMPRNSVFTSPVCPTNRPDSFLGNKIEGKNVIKKIFSIYNSGFCNGSSCSNLFPNSDRQASHLTSSPRARFLQTAALPGAPGVQVIVEYPGAVTKWPGFLSALGKLFSRNIEVTLMKRMRPPKFQYNSHIHFTFRLTVMVIVLEYLDHVRTQAMTD